MPPEPRARSKRPPQKRTSRTSYLLQALLAYTLYYLLRLLPIPVASVIGGRIGRLIGCFHRGTRRAYANLRMVMPELADRHDAIVRGMWDNLGRVLAEYSHLHKLVRGKNIEFVGVENVPDGGRIMFVTAHLGNWEVCRSLAMLKGWDMASIYRPLNNPFLDPLLRRLRVEPGQPLFAKHDSARELIRHLKAGGSVGLVGDQRLSDGLELTFFGIPALTAMLPALLAVRNGARIVPAQVERMPSGKLRVTLHPQLLPPATGTDQEKISALTQLLNDMIEDWIRQHPDQWLWMHDRWRPRDGWPKDAKT